MPRKLVLTALLTASAITFVACSDGEEATSPTQGPTVATSTSEAKDKKIEVEGHTLTPPGEQLKLGEPATVAVEKDGGSYVFYEITANAPEELTVDQAKQNSQGTLDIDDNTDHFLCFNTSVKVLGSTIDENDPQADLSLPRPTLTPTDSRGSDANRIVDGDDILCGIHDSKALPATITAADPDTTYTVARASFKQKDGTGLTPTGLSFTYDVPSVKELAHKEKVYWN